MPGGASGAGSGRVIGGAIGFRGFDGHASERGKLEVEVLSALEADSRVGEGEAVGDLRGRAGAVFENVVGVGVANATVVAGVAAKAAGRALGVDLFE